MKIITYNQAGWRAIVVAITLLLLLLMLAVPSYAGIGNDLNRGNEAVENGGNVLPPKAEPKGYSLSDMAKATAAFNVTDHSGPFPVVVDGKPFQGLFTTSTNTFNVSEGTMLYVPVILNDDSPPIIGNFLNVRNQTALESYFYSHKELGVVYTNITVGGKVSDIFEGCMSTETGSFSSEKSYAQ